jgi:NAD+ diphosphatase
MTQPKFTPSISRPDSLRYPAYWFVFQQQNILVLDKDETKIPLLKDFKEFGVNIQRELYLGEYGRTSCFGIELASETPIPSDSSLLGLRNLFGLVDEPIFALAGRAYQFLQWDRTHQYCGRCGSLNESVQTERAKKCPNCELISYPRLSPAIIVSIERGDQILLTRAPHFAEGRYSVQAGFVEPGETLEEAVEREVEEEVGLHVKNINYFGSQPWPFPHSLMIGFTAEYDSGELVLDPNEVEDAMWCTKNELPELPSQVSISRRLIDKFLNKHQ